jgi:nitroreductase
MRETRTVAEDRSPDTSGASSAPLLTDDVHIRLLDAAIRAPSLHNTQPWTFTLSADGVQLHADRSRQLAEADPTGRSMMISCGAVLFNLRVAFDHLGFHPRIRLLPEATDRPLVAVAHVDHRHSRSGTLASYYGSIPERRTNRQPFSDRPLPGAALTELTEAARVEGGALRLCEQPEQVESLRSLLHVADDEERRDLHKTRERQRWIGGRHRDDGIPARSLGPRPATPAATFRDLGHDVQLPRGYSTFESAPDLAVLFTARDDVRDWIHAGQALERLWLAATGAGIAVSLLNQALEREALRARVQEILGEPRYPQVILRVGYGPPVPPTPRRPREQFVRGGAALDEP